MIGNLGLAYFRSTNHNHTATFSKIRPLLNKEQSNAAIYLTTFAYQKETQLPSQSLRGRFMPYLSFDTDCVVF